jgi:glycosyltransferase involved in cell wall biosynthesis
MIQKCDQVWAGNSYLAQYALRKTPSVIVLPTSLTPGKYVQNTDKTTEFIDLVWIGSSSTRKYLESALWFLEDAAEKCSDLRLKIVSDFELQSSKISILNIPWSEEIEAEALASSHIGIAPMPDDAWTRGKCGLKILQYMAAGLPVISSPIGVNRDIIENGLNGFLATEPEEWIFAITKLATDPALRDRLGQSGQRQVIEHYSVNVTFQKMICLVQELTDASDIC